VHTAYHDLDGADRCPIVAWEIESTIANPVTPDADLGEYLLETPTGEFWAFNHGAIASVEAWLALLRDGLAEALTAVDGPDGIDGIGVAANQ
jgi:hypothetical protein